MTPALLFAVRLVGKPKALRVFTTWVEAERTAAGYHRAGVEVEVYEVTVASWTRVESWGGDAA
jgi:hypothetical protein